MAPASLNDRFKQSVTPDALRSYLAEFISFFYVFVVVGSAMASQKLMPGADPSSLVIVAIALSSAVYIDANVSSGHVNPAVTFSLAVGGHINSLPTYTIAAEMTGFGASVFEGVLTFGLVYTVYAAGDPRCSLLGATGPLAIGLMAGANVLAAGPFSGGSMNPACAFGSAIIAGRFKNQAVYWVGPLIGGTVAGLLYDNVVFPSQVPDSIGV
ncbi:hypothetical protein P3X46_034540 [Hevea brasiliensis]|uniref:Tonoplast intrinsic protein n=1 Tax=Hevea brasiliensis TaxID=3981 RepID=A0ABQ9K7Z8_HEVBR|nr:hypothetical protein P3X46_034540 [Hevea brasiliensis]